MGMRGTTLPGILAALALVPALGAAQGAAAQTSASAQPGKLTTEQRLQRVEDQLAISRILVDYAARLDAHDFVGYAALFAKNGEWVNGKKTYQGAEAIHKMLVGLYGPTPAGFVNSDSFHINTNFQIDVTGDRATARSRHLLILRGPKGEPTPSLAGRYEDELIREEGQWKILRRVDTPIMPNAEEWMKFIQERKASHP
jgi:hypothetical protein